MEAEELVVVHSVHHFSALDGEGGQLRGFLLEVGVSMPSEPECVTPE